MLIASVASTGFYGWIQALISSMDAWMLAGPGLLFQPAISSASGVSGGDARRQFL
jgi:hypothetical protein